MIRKIFKNTRANFQKLIAYGFAEKDNLFSFSTKIFDNQFTMLITVSKSGEISTKLIDTNTQEEYFLHLVETVTGEFVGKVRADYERVLLDIRDKCFDKEIFKRAQTKEIINYVRERYGDELEFLWEKFTADAIWRRKDNNKWYGLLLTVPENKLGVGGAEEIEIIDLRIEPELIDGLVDNEKYFRGYHMNKKSWLTIRLNGEVPTEEIISRLDNSYRLAAKK